VPASDKEAIEAALNETREALKTDDLERIKRAQETLTQASHKLAEAMYREQQAKAEPQGGDGAAGAGRPGGAKGDVVDAEFEDLGEKK
jgi:molecular chaperone DnaK